MNGVLGMSWLSPNLGIVLLGAATTVVVSAGAIVLGFLIALPICLFRLSGSGLLRCLGATYVSFFRGVPLLVQLLIIYYLLPAVGLDLPPYAAAIVALGICTAAYQAENLRGGFAIIPAGQAEAARAFGYTPMQVRRYILVPQALWAAMPALINEVILILKASSLVSVVGVADLSRVTQNIVARQLHPTEWYLLAALIYLVINLGLAMLGRATERRLGLGQAKAMI